MFPAARLALRFADSLVYVCQAQADYWQVRRLRARSSTVIHNGVDMARYATAEIAGSAADAKMRLGFAPDDYVIGLIAAFRPEKNHPQALAALHALRREGLPAKLLLVGVGPQHADIVERVRSQGLSDLVHFAGDQKDVRPFQKAMDVGMLCSTRGETFSMAALETMAMGVPMVMPALSGCVELVEGGVGGRLFETGNTTALVAALRELHDPALRAIAAKEAHETVTARFTEAIMVEKYRVLIDRLARR
jgi:glycosyltransferase involved in cell wall biosynthesis